MKQTSLPATLVSGLAGGTVIPFVGAGVSMAVRRKDGSRVFPSWKELLERAAERIEQEGRNEHAVVRAMLHLPAPDYLEIAKWARKGLDTLWPGFLEDAFGALSQDVDYVSIELARTIWRLGSKLVITTNYDRVLRWGCPDGSDLDEWTIHAPSGHVTALRRKLARPTVWHLHGSITDPTRIILCPDGYHALYATDSHASTHQAALVTLRALATSHHLLFVGFSLDDQFLIRQLEWVHDTFSGSEGPHYVLARSQDVEGMRAKVEGLGINFVTFDNFGQPLLEKLNELVDAQEQRDVAGIAGAGHSAGQPQKLIEQPRNPSTAILASGPPTTDSYTNYTLEQKERAAGGELSDQADGTVWSDAKRFVFITASAKEHVSENLPKNLFKHMIDPFDPEEALPVSRSDVFLFYPGSDYLRSGQQDFVTISAICTPQREDMLTKIQRHLNEDNLLNMLSGSPAKLRREEKRLIFESLADALGCSFVVTLAVPKVRIAGYDHSARIVYHYLNSLMLLPVLQRHRDMRVKAVRVVLHGVKSGNADLRKIAKSVTTAFGSVEMRCSAVFPERGEDDALLTDIARYVAWAVSQWYNERNGIWLEILRGVNKGLSPHG